VLPTDACASVYVFAFSGNPCAFGADLPDDIGGRDMGQQNGGYQHGADDGLRAVEDEIAGGANEGQQCGNNTLDRELKQLDRADGGRAYTQCNQFGADRDAPVAEKRVTSKLQIPSLAAYRQERN
jgi:hypothetical protein